MYYIFQNSAEEKIKKFGYLSEKKQKGSIIGKWKISEINCWCKLSVYSEMINI